MKKKVGIVGVTGKVGKILSALVEANPSFELGLSISKESDVTPQELWEKNDYVVDFSTSEVTDSILRQAILNPKPYLLCTTGFDEEQINPLLEQLSKYVPVFVLSNTSFGAYIQRDFASKISKILGSEYDIDIIEKHHRHKKDIPSGTAKTLINKIIDAKGDGYTSFMLEDGSRPDNFIGYHSIRSGETIGEHEVIFNSADETISIKHTVHKRDLFAKGAVKILLLLIEKNVEPGLYDMQRVVNEII